MWLDWPHAVHDTLHGMDKISFNVNITLASRGEANMPAKFWEYIIGSLKNSE